MTHRPITFLALLCAPLLLACGDTTDYTAAPEYWAQSDTVVIGLGHVSDVQALTRDEAWVADLGSGTILSLSPRDDRYLRIGLGDHEPVQVRLPAKLAVSPDIGLAAFDAETGSVDLFTLGGQFIRGFEPGFVPAVMSFSREPLGFTFGVAAADSSAEAGAAGAADGAAAADSAPARRALVIRTDLRGESVDTLLSPRHGPEALRSSVARPGMTSMSPSRTGMWVWSRQAPQTVFHLSPRGARRLELRDADVTAEGILADPARDMLWTVRTDTTGTTYSAYDTRGVTAAEAAEVAEAADGMVGAAAAFLGTRTTPENFLPREIHDGVVVGITRSLGSMLVSARDLNVDRFERLTRDGD